MGMGNNSLGYLASPYSHHDPKVVEYRFKETAYMAAQLMAQRRYVFSPIAMCHPMAFSKCQLPGDFEFWNEFDIIMIKLCDYLIIFPLDGWTKSSGIREEVKIAKKWNKPIFVIRMDKNHVFLGMDPYKGECNG